jgi:hypothetical protein
VNRAEKSIPQNKYNGTTMQCKKGITDFKGFFLRKFAENPNINDLEQPERRT